jgi:hypothetical protein
MITISKEITIEIESSPPVAETTDQESHAPGGALGCHNHTSIQSCGGRNEKEANSEPVRGFYLILIHLVKHIRMLAKEPLLNLLFLRTHFFRVAAIL